MVYKRCTNGVVPGHIVARSDRNFGFVPA